MEDIAPKVAHNVGHLLLFNPTAVKSQEAGDALLIFFFFSLCTLCLLVLLLLSYPRQLALGACWSLIIRYHLGSQRVPPNSAAHSRAQAVVDRMQKVVGAGRGVTGYWWAHRCAAC